MADVKPGLVLAWVLAGILVLGFALSMSMDGTWMGGMGMGWMMGFGLLLLVGAVYVAYRFGRLEQKVDDRK